MTQQIERSLEINTKNDFQDRIDLVISRKLTANNINSYADEALDDLIRVVDDATASYDQHPTIQPENGADHERAALAYFGIDANYIEVSLDHIADTSEDIHRLKGISELLAQGGIDVITPPDAIHTQIISGDGSFERKNTVPRLQTVLLILEKNFGVEIDPESADPGQFSYIPGRVTDGMMRKNPYILLDVPALNRIINVCDEEGNRTFVFDRQKLIENRITTQIIKDMTKDELKDLLNMHKGIGRGLKYSDHFVENIVSLLGHIPETDLEPAQPNSDVAKFLQVDASIRDGYMNQLSIASQLGVDRYHIAKVHKDARDELGEVLKIGGRWQYSQSQQAVIRRHIEEYRSSRPEVLSEVPEGYMSRTQLAERWNIHLSTFDKAVDALENELGDVLEANKANNIAKVYSVEQQAMIYNWLQENDYIAESVPEGYESIGSMSTKLNFGGERLIERAIKALDTELGRPKQFKSYSRVTWYYSPIQQEKIKNWIIHNAPKSKLAQLALAGAASEL